MENYLLKLLRDPNFSVKTYYSFILKDYQTICVYNQLFINHKLLISEMGKGKTIFESIEYCYLKFIKKLENLIEELDDCCILKCNYYNESEILLTSLKLEYSENNGENVLIKYEIEKSRDTVEDTISIAKDLIKNKLQQIKESIQ